MFKPISDSPPEDEAIENVTDAFRTLLKTNQDRLPPGMLERMSEMSENPQAFKENLAEMAAATPQGSRIRNYFNQSRLTRLFLNKIIMKQLPADVQPLLQRFMEAPDSQIASRETASTFVNSYAAEKPAKKSFFSLFQRKPKASKNDY